MIKIWILIPILFAIILISGCVQNVACTEDARLCPDGSSVARVPPECEFAPCPSKNCTIDSDCVVFGETGDCNCGCYNKDFLPMTTGGECFCAAPTSCKCVDNLCEGVFGECSTQTGKTMDLNEAIEIATEYCGSYGVLKQNYVCNEVTGTWWIDIDTYEKNELCNPACVVYIETERAVINWRCTGVIP